MAHKEEKATQIKGIIRDANGRPAKANLVKIRCGDCTHYKGPGHPSMGGQPCINLSIPAGQAAPDCYTANVAVFRDVEEASIKTIVGLVASFTPQQARVFAGLMRNSASLERKGMTFLQKVYFKLGQGETLDQYYYGWVFSAGPDNMIQVVGKSFLTKGASAMTAVLSKDSLFTPKEFSRIRKQLQEQGKIHAIPPRITPKESEDDYEPPTLDTSPELLAARAAGKIKAKKGKQGKDGSPAGSFVIDQRKIRAEEDAEETTRMDDEGEGDDL